MLSNISRGERDLWLKGGMEEIAIWYTSEQTGSWETCPTYFVNEPGRGGTVGRLACLAPGSGYYALRARGELLPAPHCPSHTFAVSCSSAACLL